MSKNKIDNRSIKPLNDLAKNAASQFDGIVALKPDAKYLSGARCVLRVNGEIVAFAFSVSWKISTSVTEISTIDNYMPYELAPQNISVSGSIGCFRIPGTSPGTLFMQSDILNFMHQPYIEIEVRDSKTDNLIFLTKRAMIVGRSESIKSESLADMNLEFRAIGFLDERNPIKIDDQNKDEKGNFLSKLGDSIRKIKL
jgi:hypothetical protein